MQQVIVNCLVLLLPAAVYGSFSANNALYRCGIRKRFGVSLIHSAHEAELGEWPWHVAIYHRTDSASEYKCGGTLIDQRHVLTAAHCIVNSKRKALDVDQVSVHLGKHDLRQHPEQVQIVNVSEIHVHPEYSPNRNDIAVVVLETTVPYSEFVIPICLEGIAGGWVHDLVGQRGSVAGWGETQNGSVSGKLRTAQMPVVNNTECVESDPTLFGRFISNAIYCASDRNGTSVCRGDSGGGMYFSVGSHWELRGIVSFSGQSETGSCDTNKYVVFTNVAHYYRWIRNITNGEVDQQDDIPARISERKCLEYGKLARKHGNGVCLNSRYPHVVAIIIREDVCTATIISETFLLTTAQCNLKRKVTPKVRIGQIGDVDIKRYIIHPKNVWDTATYDLQLIELVNPLSFNSRILPACLANEATENLYDSLVMTAHHSLEQNQLYEDVDNRVAPFNACNRLFWEVKRKRLNSTSAHFCTIMDVDENDADFIALWFGFAGAPLQMTNSRSCMFNVVGILFGGTDFKSQMIAQYSRISANIDWIEQVVWGDETQLSGPSSTEVSKVEHAVGDGEPVAETITESATEQTTASVLPKLRYAADFFFPDGFD